MKHLRSIAVFSAAAFIALILLELYTQAARAIGYRDERVLEATRRDKTLLDDLAQGRRTIPPEQRKILILGDSMAYSPGVSSEDLWSAQLENNLSHQAPWTVINAARPGGNTGIELEAAKELLPLVRPDIVLLVYNYNDVYGRRTSLRPKLRAALPAAKKPPAASSRWLTAQDTWLVRLSYALKEGSAFLDIALPRLNAQLKRWGILVPGSGMEHVVKYAYRPESKPWKLVQGELRELRELSEANGAQLTVAIFPQFHSLERDWYAMPRQAVSSYLQSLKIPVCLTFDHFKGRPWDDYAISPFDPHPNARANRELAELIEQWLESAVPMKR